jgi:hypothetical protein
MPAISLVVCVHNQRDLLARLLSKTEDLYNDLVVVHDGPVGSNEANSSIFENSSPSIALDFSYQSPSSPLPRGFNEPGRPALVGSINELVLKHEGRFYEHPRIGSLEGQSPFAWSRAANDWILRLDADEFPSDELKDWLIAFRNKPDPPNEVSGYTCLWPCWNGKRAVTQKWPGGRVFLFHRQRVRFIGIPEQTVIADTVFEPLPLTLHHQPARRSHGLRNVLMRKQAFHWRRLIVRALLGRPVDLPRWRWSSEDWPERWAEVRRHPLRTAWTRLVFDGLRTFRDEWRAERRIHFGIGASGPVYHALFCVRFWRLRRSLRQTK